MLELPPDLLYKLGKNHVRNAEIIKRLVEIVLNSEAKSIIFFATSLEQSKLIASLLNFLNIKAEHVDGETSRPARELVIKKFRAQEIQVLCNYEVLSTGFDAPLVDCVFIARPTASVVLYSQMIGRGLRGPAVGGKSKCLIVNVRDNFSNLPSINTMYKIFDDYWTGVD
jgi:superfamily II DNA or RNA helicase